jgi:hypothetical protein
MDNTTQAPCKGAQFESITITILGYQGGSTWPGRKLGDTGLGYWIAGPEDEEDNGPTFYQPTHIPSGYAACSDRFYSEEQCQNYIKALAPLLNWNVPLEALVANPNYPPKELTEIYHKYILEDAAATAGGGAW